VACCRVSFIFTFTFLTSAPPVCLHRVLLQRWGSLPFLYSYPSFRDFEEPGYRSRYIDWATSWTIWCSNSGRGKTFFCHLKPPYRLCKPRRLLFNGYRVLWSSGARTPLPCDTALQWRSAVSQGNGVQCRRKRGGKEIQITGVWLSGMARPCRVFCLSRRFIICRLNKLTLSDQAQVTLQLTVFPISCKDFYLVHPCRGLLKKKVVAGARARCRRAWRSWHWNGQWTECADHTPLCRWLRLQLINPKFQYCQYQSPPLDITKRGKFLD